VAIKSDQQDLEYINKNNNKVHNFMKQKSHINKYQIKEKDTRIKNNQIHKIENHKSKGDKNKDSLSF